MDNLVKIAEGDQANWKWTGAHHQDDTVSGKGEGTWDRTVLLTFLDATFKISIVAIFECEAEEIVY